MSFTLVLTGIVTGTLAAIYAISLESGVVWAMISYITSGTLALLGAGLVTAVRRNRWSFGKRGYRSGRMVWKHRLDDMARQSTSPAQIGPFQGS